MGQYDIFIIGGVAVAGGYYLYTHPEILEQLFPPATEPPVTDPPVVIDPPVDGEDGGGGDGNGGNGGGGDGGNGGGSGGYDCARACRNCWCKSYSENCSGGCSKCCGGSRIASKCNGQGVKTCTANQAYVQSMAARGFEYPYNNLRLTIA